MASRYFALSTCVFIISVMQLVNGGQTLSIAYLLFLSKIPDALFALIPSTVMISLTSIHAFYYEQQSCWGSNFKNVLKARQVVKQPLELKTPMLSKKIYFFHFKFTEAKLIHNRFWCNLIVYNNI